MRIAEDIIIAPIITEKSMSGTSDKKYTYKVASDAGKIEIAQAVEKDFKLKKGDVIKVNTMNVRGQMRRMGRYSGYTPAWKKAIVTLSDKAKPIEFFEGLR